MVKVVFACTENKKRSQLAEAIFNHLARQSQSVSGGTFPADKIDPLTIKSLREIGLPTKNLYPKQLNNSDLNSADIIVSFGCLNPYLFPKGKFQEWRIKVVGDDVFATAIYTTEAACCFNCYFT